MWVSVLSGSSTKASWSLVPVSVLLVVVSCGQAPRLKQPERFQGVIELQELTLGFEVSGRLSALQVKTGDWVSEGDVLASIDDSLAKLSLRVRAAEVKAAEARYALLSAGVRKEELDAIFAQLRAAKDSEALYQKNLKRQETLVANGAVAASSLDEIAAGLSRAKAERKVLEDKLSALKKGTRAEELEAALAQVEAAQAGLSLEEERLTRYQLKAPSSGKVVETYLERGELIAMGVPILTLADTKHPYVDIFIPQGRISGVSIGSVASVWVDAEKEPVSGKVASINRRVEFTPRFLFSEEERSNLVLRVRIQIDDPQERLHSGVPAFVELKDLPKGGD